MGISGEVLSGWSATANVRKNGASIGHVDVSYYSGDKRKFRSRKVCLQFLNSEHKAQQMPKVPKRL